MTIPSTSLLAFSLLALFCASTAARAPQAPLWSMHLSDQALLSEGTTTRLSLQAAARDGLNGFICKSNGDCSSGRECVDPSTLQDGKIDSCSSSSQTCFCLKLPFGPCTAGAACDAGETCAKLDDTWKSPYCWSCTVLAEFSAPVYQGQNACPGAAAAPAPAAPAPAAPASAGAGGAGGAGGAAGAAGADAAPGTAAGATPAPFIGVSHLEHLDRASLVFAEHQRSAVLCDAGGSCATAGHIVEFRGKAMKMARYCAEQGCAERTMLVNSPRLARGVRVPSRTPGLQFTALSARYGTDLEEKCMRVLVRLGW